MPRTPRHGTTTAPPRTNYARDVVGWERIQQVQRMHDPVADPRSTAWRRVHTTKTRMRTRGVAAQCQRVGERQWPCEGCRLRTWHRGHRSSVATTPGRLGGTPRDAPAPAWSVRPMSHHAYAAHTQASGSRSSGRLAAWSAAVPHRQHYAPTAVRHSTHLPLTVEQHTGLSLPVQRGCEHERVA